MFNIFKYAKENKKLMQDNYDLINQLHDLNHECETANLRAKELSDRLARKDQELKSRGKVIDTLKEELAKVQELVREQTEADLLANGLKAVGIIKEEEKKPLSYYQGERAELYARAQAAAMCRSESHGSGQD